MRYIVGVDIGGTFTDCVAMDERGTITLGKALSTPDDFSRGALDSVRDAALRLGFSDQRDLLRATKLFFHACTIGDNTLVTRTGAKTGLITTRGFGDTLLHMRGRTTEGLTETEAFHAAAQQKPPPIVPRPLIQEVGERVDYKGTVLVRLDPADVQRAIRDLLRQGVESVGVCLLWALTNDAHEQAIAKIIKELSPSMHLTLSSEVAPYVGEYERTATTAVNAYIAPKIAVYLHKLKAMLGQNGLEREPLVMQSYGGVLRIEETCRNSVGIIESGPAAGVVGSRFIGERIGVANILATDMGGTTFKVSVIRNGLIEKDYKPIILRYQLYLTKIWVESIGAGGGSIAWIDPESGLLKVGPRGAGAYPGPVCYGHGGAEVTVSDADLALGYLSETYFLGGKMALDKGAALKVLEEKIARPMGMRAVEAASGIYRIINSHMSDLIRRATVERGYDPREFTLFAFGGAAGVHAGRYGADLGIRQVIIPLTASVHGATGLVSSDVICEYGKSDQMPVPADLSRIHRNFSALAHKAVEHLSGAGFKEPEMRIVRSVDIRYRNQVHELNVPLRPGAGEVTAEDMEGVYAAFDELYEQTYGIGAGYREAGKEIMAFRILAAGALDKPHLRSYPLVGLNPDRGLKGERPVYFQESGDFVATRIYDFDGLKPGNEVRGPAVIETPITTVVVNPGDRAAIDEFLNVRLFLQGA